MDLNRHKVLLNDGDQKIEVNTQLEQTNLKKNISDQVL